MGPKTKLDWYWLRKIFFCVHRRKQVIVLERHECEKLITEFFIFEWTITSKLLELLSWAPSHFQLMCIIKKRSCLEWSRVREEEEKEDETGMTWRERKMMINWKLGETSCVKVKERERRKHEGEGVRNARCQEFSSLTVWVRVPRVRVNYSIKITSLGHAIYRGQPTINLPSPTTHRTRAHTHKEIMTHGTNKPNIATQVNTFSKLAL